MSVRRCCCVWSQHCHHDWHEKRINLGIYNKWIYASKSKWYLRRRIESCRKQKLRNFHSFHRQNSFMTKCKSDWMRLCEIHRRIRMHITITDIEFANMYIAKGIYVPENRGVDFSGESDTIRYCRMDRERNEWSKIIYGPRDNCDFSYKAAIELIAWHLMSWIAMYLQDALMNGENWFLSLSLSSTKFPWESEEIRLE